jgi:hypothetical protein
MDATTKIDWPRGDQDLAFVAKSDHPARRSAASTTASVSGSTPAGTRTSAPLVSISIIRPCGDRGRGVSPTASPLAFTIGLPIECQITTADMQDRDALAPLLKAVHRKSPWVKMSFVYGGYQGDEAQRAAFEASRISITVVKRTDKEVKGFDDRAATRTLFDGGRSFSCLIPGAFSDRRVALPSCSGGW